MSFVQGYYDAYVRHIAAQKPKDEYYMRGYRAGIEDGLNDIVNEQNAAKARDNMKGDDDEEC